MLNDIILGIRDFWKHKIVGFFYILFFIAILYTLVSSTRSLLDSKHSSTLYDLVTNKTTTFSTYIIGKDFINVTELLNNLSSIYSKNSSTFCYLPLKANNNDYVECYILFGDCKKFNSYFNTKDDFHIFAGKNMSEIKTISLDDKIYPVNSYMKESHNFFESNQIVNTDNYIFIVINNPNLLDWISSENSIVIKDLINNTKILSYDVKRINDFLNYSSSNLFEVHVYDHNIEEQEVSFIQKIIHPFIIAMIIACFLITYIIIDELIQKNTREYTIYLLHGAKISNILVRFMTFFIIILALALLLGYYLKAIHCDTIYIYILLSVIIISLLNITILINLKRKNLYANLRKGL